MPLYLKIRGVIAKSFARIHKDNLINNGILPLTFQNEADYDRFDVDDELELKDIRKEVAERRFCDPGQERNQGLHRQHRARAQPPPAGDDIGRRFN